MDSEKCTICKKQMERLLKFPNGNFVLQCRKCGLRGLRPLPNIQTIRNFYDREDYYRKDISALHDDLVFGYDENAPIIRLYKKHLQKIIKLKPPPAKLLEIGCARGVFGDLAQKSGYKVTGMEINTYACEYAKEKFNLNIEQATIEAVDFEPESFDIIVAFDVIEHLIDPELLIKKSSLFLKENGLLAIGTPNSKSLVNYLSEKMSVFTANLCYYPAYRFYGRGEEHLNIFSPHNLTLLLQKNRFKLKAKYGYNIPLKNMCDAGFISKTGIFLLTILPYEFSLIACKEQQ